MADLQGIFKELKTEFGAVTSAVLSRDGTLIAGDIPKSITPETLTIMCATIMGAAVTAHSELKIGQPKFISTTSNSHEMLVFSAGRKAIILTVVPRGVKMDDVQRKMLKIIDIIND